MGSLTPESPRGPAEAGRIGAAFWSATRQAVEQLEQDWSGVNVYQDGLPDSLPALVDKVVSMGPGQNYELLRWLIERGAAVLGTEDPSLLLEEHRLLKAINDARGQAGGKARAEYARRAPALLRERDGYIARRIDATLSQGRTGVLFIGAAHQVEKKLPRDIVVRRFDTYPTKATP